ncbi:Sec-independent protein translocase protein TatCy [Microbacterium lemovicicum]|uniref:Sec-independent protein translocase protein TatC n=1 Tax=Microbacterium lemovicicum TaxID=1072463 RepID=A0A3Q9J1Y4_9MICO|nr:twin-arginine translocase subunit TatC [Microbacterium lemovicicum]AZS36693.1 Sec-independent protein translocase protein TatCy [Microbacterium lemovicicum]
MSLGQHLVELRKRLLISAIGLVAGMIIAFFLAEPIIDLLTVPISVIAERTGKAVLNFDTVTGAFDLQIRIAFAVGLIISSPVWLSQIWLFIAPGMTRKEARYTVGFLGAAIPLFFGGTFAGWLIMPHIIELMSSFVPDGAANFFQYSYYYDFILKLLLVVGVAFVLPVFLVLLNIAGILSGMAILRGWRFAIIAITVFCALATPAADVISMFLLAIPMLGLYFAAVGIALLVDRRRARRAAAELAAGAPA